MIRFLTALFLLTMTFAFSSNAQESTGGTSSKPIILDSHPIDNNSKPKPHRAPMSMNIEAYYDQVRHSIKIYYDGEADGEVFLYLNDNVVGYSSEINTTFQIEEPGIYRVDILCDSWIAEGSIQL